MRPNYPYHYSPTEEELKKAGETALFVFDTNVLLDVLRLSPELSKKIITVISSCKTRIRIPSHVDKEYHKRLLETPAKMGNSVHQCIQRYDYSEIDSVLKPMFKLKDGLQFPKDCLDSYLARFKALFDEIKEELVELREHYNELYFHQDFQYKISELLHTQVLSKISETDLEAIKKEGADRYAKEIPPGYMDDSKDEENKYGDLIIWKEILILASQNQDKAIFFISNDRKDDWVYQKYKKTWGPRLELLEEFGKVSKQIFYIYTLDQFLKFFSPDALSNEELNIVSQTSDKNQESDDIKATDKEASYSSDIKYTKNQPALKATAESVKAVKTTEENAKSIENEDDENEEKSEIINAKEKKN